MTALDAAKAKVNWAEKHFGDFKDILFGPSSGLDNRKTTILHYDLQREPHRGPSPLFAPPRECRLAFGDAVHQLRSSLDHLVCGLARRPTKGNTDTVCEDYRLEFPIHKDARDFSANWRISQGVFERLLGPDELTAIENAQPYKRNRTNPEADPLWLLKELDNIDKHRTILVVNPRLMTKYLTADGQVQVVKHPFVSDAEGFSVAITVPEAPGEVDAQERAVIVVLSETGLACDNTQAIAVWRQMVGAVMETIQRFERFF